MIKTQSRCTTPSASRWMGCKRYCGKGKGFRHRTVGLVSLPVALSRCHGPVSSNKFHWSKNSGKIELSIVLVKPPDFFCSFRIRSAPSAAAHHYLPQTRPKHQLAGGDGGRAVSGESDTRATQQQHQQHQMYCYPQLRVNFVNDWLMSWRSLHGRRWCSW